MYDIMNKFYILGGLSKGNQNLRQAKVHAKHVNLCAVSGFFSHTKLSISSASQNCVQCELQPMACSYPTSGLQLQEVLCGVSYEGG